MFRERERERQQTCNTEYIQVSKVRHLNSPVRFVPSHLIKCLVLLTCNYSMLLVCCRFQAEVTLKEQFVAVVPRRTKWWIGYF